MLYNNEFVGLGDRFVARIIDNIIIFAVAVIMIVAGIFLAPILTLFGVVFWIFGDYFYRIILHKLYGQTIGKKALGIKVIKTNGENLGWSNAILREIGVIVCIITIGIGYLLIIFDKEKQGLHDKIAGTFVVRVKK